LASPLLGSSEHPWFVQAGMRLGVIGQTGKDLALVPRSRSEQEHAKGAVEEDTIEEPLLLALAQPTSPSHVALRQFQNRTIYANVGNDVSVSFRTSALYFYNHREVSIHKNNLLRQLYSLLNPPEATKEYLTRSITSASPIIHDKVYMPSDIPRSRGLSARLEMEEKIARAWHEDMSWRKVFVQLEGEAHTNVIVRRRWQNAAGWQVIDHLLKEHEF
ncbi:14338_t:CDS:1, partial [Acaulospora morrowiae]